jgi:hypothetical protein
MLRIYGRLLVNIIGLRYDYDNLSKEEAIRRLQQLVVYLLFKQFMEDMEFHTINIELCVYSDAFTSTRVMKLELQSKKVRPFAYIPI